MKDSDQPKNTGTPKRDQSFYAVVLVCLLAVGIAGYVLVSAIGGRGAPAPGHAELSAPLESEDLPETDPDAPIAAPTAAPVAEAPEEPEPLVRVPPVKGEVIRPFSLEKLAYNDTTQDWRLHDAVDLAAEGQTVLASMAGTVERVYDDDYLGTTVILRHSGGYETHYSNLTAMPTVKAGDSVKAGDVIGAVGDTAIIESADKPHLHFQVLKDGKPVDPSAFLKN
ncbi:MAG: M23 family metallopeptidase [Oscillospiraceae bacterium]|nr:M23 family metallopeptidase [Oscillospiraceae bacterium]